MTHRVNTQLVVLSHRALINGSYPYDEKLRAAKRWLTERGITQVKPLYRPK